MDEIVFVGLGLDNEGGISLHGLNEAKTADRVFVELYTSVMPGLSLDRLEKLCGKNLHVLQRKDIEELNGRALFDAAQNGKVVLLVPGDPLIATTHNILRIEAAKRGIATRVVHGASAFSAIIGVSGLHSYKFGKIVTIPFPDETMAETPYNVIAENKRRGLHTLCLLDIKAEEKRHLSVPEALRALLDIEQKRKIKVANLDSLIVIVARAGSDDALVKADFVRALFSADFGEPPFSILFPSKLHFTEAEALIVLAGAPQQIRGLIE